MPRSPIEDLKDAARRGELVCVVGTGVSITLTNNTLPALSWKGLIQAGFVHAVQKQVITQAKANDWRPQIDSGDLDELILAAEFMGRKLGAPNGDLYARFLQGTFNDVTPVHTRMADAIRRLASHGVPLATLNYDTLLERVTGQLTITLADTAKSTAWMRHGGGGILHLHGVWDAPATCILGVRDYQTTLENERRDLLQRALSAYRRLLFVGCGDTFADPNFTSLIRWLRTHMEAAAPEHYALVREADLAARHADESWHGFVSPVSYGPDFGDLPDFLLRVFAPVDTASPQEKAGAPERSNVTHAKLVADYRAFLVKDCGQHAFEGVPADPNVAQRKFDMERIFVPLSIQRLQDEKPATSPANDEPVAFGRAFAEHRRLALLALPGGGKTMLLRRLAIAYADPRRRASAADALPDLDLLPVLIRCREWRDHLKSPIPTLLQRLPDITGQPHLEGLHGALMPLFREGQVLLLVDGLDEIHDEQTRATFVGHLASFLDDHEKCRLVATSREAGFALVAQTISQFCEPFRVAPLSEEAITTLCASWHTLMAGDSPESRQESSDVSKQLTTNESLRGLAENPLLLTMLLVVKQGYGRLPPDRVSLYDRAVEVLLDTWNIKAHARLSPREAIPQLAYVAYEMMRAGKQTATEDELLRFIESARESVPKIQLYAKDTPLDFLRRVELRSGLIVESGRQADGAGTIALYQFRHLTFQEYLAAVAAADGHYAGHTPGDTVLKPLEPYLTADEWKEVIPMAAVLAKHADPLLQALVSSADAPSPPALGLKRFFKRAFPSVHPAVDRLMQCLVEEAQVTPDVRTAALQKILVTYARHWTFLPLAGKSGLTSIRSLAALCRGPYGDDLRRQSWQIFSALDWDSWRVPKICGLVSSMTSPEAHWTTTGRSGFEALLRSERPDDVGLALLGWCERLTSVNVLRAFFKGPARPDAPADSISTIEAQLFHEDPSVRCAAALTWQQLASTRTTPPEPAVLTQLLNTWLNAHAKATQWAAASALAAGMRWPRESWSPTLTDEQVQTIRLQASLDPPFRDAALAVAYYNRAVFSDDQLIARITQIESPSDGHKNVLSSLVR